MGTLLFVSVGLVSPTAFPFRSQKSIGFSTLEVPFKALLQIAKLTSNFQGIIYREDGGLSRVFFEVDIESSTRIGCLERNFTATALDDVFGDWQS